MTAGEPQPTSSMTTINPVVDEADLSPPSSEVLHLWTEVGKGIDKSQTVVWKSAVESLDFALKHFASSNDARVFVEKYMSQIIGILVEQQPAKIGIHERNCVQESMILAVKIVSTDLKIQVEQKGECQVLSTLSLVFNKKKPFFKANKGSWNVNHLIGLPEVRLRNIECFRATGGFQYLEQYLLQKIGSPVFPKLEILHQILQAVVDAIPTRQASGEQAAAVKQMEDDSIGLSNAVMKFIDGISDEDMKKFSTDYLSTIQHDLQKIFDRLVATRRGSTYAFYAFWRNLVHKLITSQSLPLKLFGWEQVGDLIDACADHRPPPRCYTVNGAGCSFVNGAYEFAGEVTQDGYAKPGSDVSYTRKIPENEEGAGKKLTLFRCTMRSQQKWWFLSEADEEQPGTDRDIDYYQHKSKENEEAAPPATGWITCRSAGVDPPPTLEATGVLVPPGCEYETLEHQLAKWAIENEIVEQVLGDTTIHREVVARSTVLIKFLAAMCNRYNIPPISMDDPQPNTYSLQASHLLYAWKTCTRKADAAVSSQVYQLLVSILPLCPTSLAIPLLKAIQTSLQESDEKRDYLYEVSEFCSALASANLHEGKNVRSVPLLSDDVREEVLELLWSVLTHPDASSLKSYDLLKRYVTNELRVEPKGSVYRVRFFDHCAQTLYSYAEKQAGVKVNESQSLRMVKLTQFVLESCPRQQAEELVTRNAGGLPRTVFLELLAYMDRFRSLGMVQRSSSWTETVDVTAHQNALNERLRVLRFTYGLANEGKGDSISMTLEKLETLWRVCEAPDDREACMFFIANASSHGKVGDYSLDAATSEMGGLNTPHEKLLAPAFSEEVCFSVFSKLFCSPIVDYEVLRETGYRSFQILFKRLRHSSAPISCKKEALDALWRICLCAAENSVASQARKDLLSVYYSVQNSKLVPNGTHLPSDKMLTDDIEDNFGERMFLCLQRVKSDINDGIPSAMRSSDRCLRILNAAVGQHDAEVSLTASTLVRLGALPPAVTLDQAVRCLPHGMRGESSCMRIGIVAKRPQMQNPINELQPQGGLSSTVKCSLSVHPLETLTSLKTRVAQQCRCPRTAVKPVQINGRSSNKVLRSSSNDLANFSFNSVTEDTVMDELGIVEGSEVVFLIAERNQQAPIQGKAPRNPCYGDLSDIFFADDGPSADRLFDILFSILDSLEWKCKQEMDDTEQSSVTDAHQLVWDILFAMPTNQTVANRVKSAHGRVSRPATENSEDAMDVDSSAETWMPLLDTRHYDRSVYVLLTIDSLLQPALTSISTLPHDARLVLEKQMSEERIFFRQSFIDAGGFEAIVRFFSTSHDEYSPAKIRRGNAVALRILKACLFSFSLQDQVSESGMSLDEVGGHLLQSLTDAEGLMKSLTAMVVEDAGITSSTIANVLGFLKLLLRSPRATQGFLSLPDGLTERFLLALLLWDDKVNQVQTASSISASMNVRKSSYDLIIQTPLLADRALPWLIQAISHVEASSESTHEYFDALEKLVSDRAGVAGSRTATLDELDELALAVCKKIVMCPRPSKETDLLEFSTGVLCGCLKLLRAIIECGGSAALLRGTEYLIDHLHTARWTSSLKSSDHSSVDIQPRSPDANLIDLMGAVFDGLLSPGLVESIPACCDKESRRRGFDVVGAAARSCKNGLGYLALVQRVNMLTTSVAPQLRHKWGQFSGAIESPSRGRGSSKYSGLRNQGCTCYMNSVLQQLFMMPELRKSMCSAQLPSSLRCSNGKVPLKGSELVGHKISLQWDSGVSYDAMVEGYDSAKGMHRIRYLPIHVATISTAGQNQVQPEDIERLPPFLPDEFILSEGRPGKETGVYDLVTKGVTDGNDKMTGLVSDRGEEPIKETEDESASRHLLEEVQRTFVHLEEGSRGRCFDPRALVEACSCLKLEFDVWQQNDASEFATKLLDRLEISLKRWAPENFKYMDHTFGLKQTKQKICKECGLKTNREEKLLNIDCQIRGKSDIHEALAAMTEVEIMEGSNKVFCDKCKTKTDTILRTAISTLPNVLILSLKRFDLDYNTFETVKLNSRCAFGQTLNLKPYTLEGMDNMEHSEGRDPSPMDTEGSQRGEDDAALGTLVSDEEYEYVLAGVLVHAGVAQGGHYYSFIKDRTPGASGKWYRFDDEDVSPFDPSLIEAECFGGRVKKETKWPNGQIHTVEQEQYANALMLFYEKVKPSPLPAVDLEQSSTASSDTPNVATNGGYEAFRPDVQRSNAMHRWQSFLFDAEFQTFLKAMLGFCRLSSSTQHDSLSRGPDGGSWTAPVVDMLLSFVFEVMMYSSETDSFSDWTRMLEELLLLDRRSAQLFVHNLARKSREVSSNWLRSYLLDCPDQRLRSMAVRIFTAAIKTCGSDSSERSALLKWTQAWKEQVTDFFSKQGGSITSAMPLSLQGKWGVYEDIDRIGSEASSLGVIISFLNHLLEAMPRCWRFSSELCLFVRNLASMPLEGSESPFRKPMVEAMLPGRLLALAARDRSPLFLRMAFPGASVSVIVANTQIHAESNIGAHVMMHSSHVIGGSDLNAPRGPIAPDYLVLFEALLSLMGLRGVTHVALVRDTGDVRGRQRYSLSDDAVKALTTVFHENCAPGNSFMNQHNIELYLHRCHAVSAALSHQKIHDLLSKYSSNTGPIGPKPGSYLTLEGFLSYYRDCVQTNDLRLRLDLHAYGFRPDLSRRSSLARYNVIGEKESIRHAGESVACDVAELLGDKPADIGVLANDTLVYTFDIYSLAFNVSEPLMEYLVAAATYKRKVDTLTSRILQKMYQLPNDWNGNDAVNALTTALQVIASIPGEGSDARIAQMMKSNTKASRNVEHGAGLLQVLQALHHSRPTQHYTSDMHWTFDRYIRILKELLVVHPVFKWMQQNREAWSFIESELLDTRPSTSQQAQSRSAFDNRGVTVPLEQNTDDEMGGMGDSEEDDEDSRFDQALMYSINDGPYQVVVEGAGNPAVNGTYNQDGYLYTTCRYAMEGTWNGRQQRFSIFQCNVSNNTKHWYISIVPYDGSPGTSSDIDFYTAPMTDECTRYPPKRGWATTTEGKDPPPTITFVEHGPNHDRMWNGPIVEDDNAENQSQYI